MYNHLKGVLARSDPTSVVIECSGAGYSLRVPVSTYEKLPAQGEECLLLTYLHVREDVLELYGFTEEVERRLFKKLLGVAGVGPVAAISLMSQNTVEEICGAIKRNDPSPLKKTKGIGKKTADRVCLELRGAVEELETMMSAEARGRVRETVEPRDVVATTALALTNLGYSQNEAERAAREAADALGDGSLGEVLKEALKRVR
jgi:Holliday junction DNA helicase RuvA